MTSDPVRTWRLSDARSLPLDRPRIMTILNVTPDSFSDGGRLTSPQVVADAAQRARDDGADMLDIGGESTRPGAERVSEEEQVRRTAPAIEAVRAAGVDLPISIDTTLSGVARRALDAGADAINDVSGATEDPAMLPLAAERSCGIVLMHRLVEPGVDSYSDQYTERPDYAGDVVGAVRAALERLLSRAIDAGVESDRIVLDPGLGFGKTVEQNVELVMRSRELLTLGRPLLSGASRKSFVGRASAAPGREPLGPDGRVAGSVAFSLMHMLGGARLFRVHDTAEHAAALRAGWMLAQAGERP